MPREKVKNNRAHEVQLSSAAIEVLNSIPRNSFGLLIHHLRATPVSGLQPRQATPKRCDDLREASRTRR
jgi:hypothetical protein